MNKAAVRRFSVCRYPALLMLSVAFSGNPALTWSKPSKAAVGESALFTCHADQQYQLKIAVPPNYDDPLEATSPRGVDEEVSLVVDIKSRRMSLIIQVEGGPTWTHLLNDVAQGSSPGSGAGGKADTTIRGASGGTLYTLFASYDSNGFDHDATLQVSGTNDMLLGCDSDMYEAPTVKGLGRFGSTNIYALAADGLVAKMSDLPVEPAIRALPDRGMSEKGRFRLRSALPASGRASSPSPSALSLCRQTSTSPS